MRVSPGVRLALSEASKWLVVSAVGIVTFVWFDELKAGVSQALDHNPAQRQEAPNRKTTSGPGKSRSSLAMTAISPRRP